MELNSSLFQNNSQWTSKTDWTIIMKIRSLMPKLFIFVCLLHFAFPQNQAHANTEPAQGLYIKIGEASVKKSPMAIPLFQFTGSPGSARNNLKVGKDLFDVFRNDMDISGYFDLIKEQAFLENTATVGLKPIGEEAGGFNFSSWKQIGTEFLVRAGYRVLNDSVTLDTYTYHVPQARLILNKTYKGQIADVRWIAHTFANDLIKELTGQPGVFKSKIVVSRTTRPQQKEIFVLDWDGANARQVSQHKSIAISPTWSFDGKVIAYSAFGYHPKDKTRNLDLFTYELQTGRRFLVSYRRGINSGASFTPDNRHLLLTLSNLGVPDIFKMSLDGRSLIPLTKGRGSEMNVEPVMSPDGNRIAFSSTRSGKPMIYVMNADGSNIKRMTFAGVYNSTPAWSPDSKKLAFAGQDSNHFDIFVMNADGTNMVRLTSAAKKVNGKSTGRMANNEDPSFSPDGRQVLFRSDRTGNYQLYIASINGQDEHRITFDQHEYFKPRWSPALD
jgi:TolB protein